MCKPNLKCRRGIFFVPLLLLAMGTWGQSRYPQGFYSSPLPEPLGLSGSFGEIRSRHFHAGTDLRTGGKEGMPVRAVMDGEIVRINVAVSGYGRPFTLPILTVRPRFTGILGILHPILPSG